MTYRYNHRPSRWNHGHAAHAVVAAQSLVFDPTEKPDAALIADRKAKRPNYSEVVSIDPKVDYIVLDVPFGRKGSAEIRQWAKRIGARWNNSHKEWRITATRVDADRLAIINSLRLYLNHTTKAASVYLARLGSPECLVFLQIPFEEKDTAKADGARWDTATRRWYFPMRGNLGSAAFSRKVAKYEANGWVDVAATEAYNAPTLGMTPANLAKQREPNRLTAEIKAFVQAQSTKVFSVSAEEKIWLSVLQSHVNPKAECMDQWLLRRVDTNGLESWIRIHRIDGCSILRMQFRGGYAGAKWDSGAFETAEKIREVWNQAIAGGYQLYTNHRMTGPQAVVLVATGKFIPNPMASEIGAAHDTLQQREMGNTDVLR